MAKQDDLIYIGIGGHVVAIERTTGAERWRTKLRSSSYVTISVDGDAIYAGAAGELFCVDRATGALRWRNRLSGLGTSIVAFDASSTTSALVAAAVAAQAAAVAAASAG